MRAHIISSAPIEHELPGHDLYDSFSLVSQGILDAPLTKEAAAVLARHQFSFDPLAIAAIIAAPHGQTLDTAKLLVEQRIVPDALILETRNAAGVRFTMESLISKEEFVSRPYGEAIAEARRAFVEKLFANELEESFDSVAARIEGLLGELRAHSGEVLCISHGFYMKLLEIYVREPDAFSTLEGLLRAFAPENRPYEPLGGFDIDI